jgi:dihydrofolate reductase
MNQVKPISIIVAIAENNGIGKNNQLLVHLPEDLKWFKRITQGHKVIMGKLTYFSLPKRPLPGRTNVVLSDIPGEQIDGCLMAYSIPDVIEQCDQNQESFIIGGASVYRQCLPHTQKLYITKIHASLEADTFFPEIDPLQWEIVESEKHYADEKHPFAYTFVIYKRIQK